MKKFIKFTLGVVSITALVGGVVYFVKNILMKDSWDDLDDDFDDDFEDELEDELEATLSDVGVKDGVREYVTLNVNESEEVSKSNEDTTAEAEA